MQPSAPANETWLTGLVLEARGILEHAASLHYSVTETRVLFPAVTRECLADMY